MMVTGIEPVFVDCSVEQLVMNGAAGFKMPRNALTVDRHMRRHPTMTELKDKTLAALQITL
jgi:hypothetical protein